MNWVLEFYNKQNEWSGCASGAVTDNHCQKADLVEEFVGPGSKRILELGAGGGQVAAAMADLGHDVTAIELVPSLTAYARQFAKVPRAGTLTVIEGDFYTVTLAGLFDVICYWDGFGVGTDADQRQLLRRLAGWLTPEGSALIEISTPWYPASVNGRGWEVGEAERQYSFDADGCRWLDKWWPKGHPELAVQQSIRCYSPADLRLLVASTGLKLRRVKSGGTVDWEQGQWLPSVPLERAMQYIAQFSAAS